MNDSSAHASGVGAVEGVDEHDPHADAVVGFEVVQGGLDVGGLALEGADLVGDLIGEREGLHRGRGQGTGDTCEQEHECDGDGARPASTRLRDDGVRTRDMRARTPYV